MQQIGKQFNFHVSLKFSTTLLSILPCIFFSNHAHYWFTLVFGTWNECWRMTDVNTYSIWTKQYGLLCVVIFWMHMNAENRIANTQSENVCENDYKIRRKYISTRCMCNVYEYFKLKHTRLVIKTRTWRHSEFRRKQICFVEWL